MNIFQTANDIHGDGRAAITDLLYRLADDDLVIGHRHTEWTGLAPILEADIAMSSIAQDQIGHALAYYKLLQELGEPDPDTLVFTREPRQYRCASLCVLDKRDWAFTTVRQFLYDTAKRLRIESLRQSAYLPLARLVGKLRGEHKYHLMHARMWTTRLGDATEESRRLMQNAVDELLPHALGLFEPTDHARSVAAAGLGPDEASLCREWQRDVNQLLTDAGLSFPADPQPVYGGRRGRHPDALAKLLDAVQKVYRLDPTASW